MTLPVLKSKKSIAFIAAAAVAAILLLVPVRLQVSYTAPIYDNGAIDASAIDARLYSLAGIHYRVTPTQSSPEQCGQGDTPLTVRYGPYRTEITLTPVAFDHYALSASQPLYEQQPVSAGDFEVTAVYADGAELPVEAKVSLSGPLAVAGNTATVSGLYGSAELPLEYIALTTLSPSEASGTFEGIYADGTRMELAPGQAADYEAPQLVSCLIEDGQLQLTVQAPAGADRYYAAFYCDGNGLKGEESLGLVYGSGDLVITLPWQTQFLQESFAVVAVSTDAEPDISNRMYLTNPGAIAERQFERPVQASKKGLQVNVNLLDELEELGTHHTLINITLDQLAVGDFEYQYNGETYYFNSSYIAWLDAYTAALGKLGVTTTAVLLLQYSDACSYLILPGARVSGHTYYGFNVAEPAPKNMLAAMFTFLAERYSDEEHLVLNWILGNEVANFRDWYYSGNISYEQYVDNYVQAFRLLDSCTKSVYAYSKSYMSLDNCWCFHRSFAYLGKNMLDTFAQSMEQYGEIDWGLAYHAHSEPLSDPSFWTSTARVSNSIYSQMISMKNLNYLTDYIRDTYGAEHTLILSETGFSSSAEGEDVQAAAMAYAYYLVEENDMVDALLLHRQSDDPSEMKTNFYFGLWSNLTGEADGYTARKKAWTVYKYMDTDPSYTAFAPAVIGVSSWADLLKNPPQ